MPAFVASVDYGAGNGTGEVLAAVLRPGNAGANSADDHIKVFTAAIAQLPDAFYDQDGALIGEKVLVRTDSAGASRKFLHYLANLGVQFSVSYPVPVMKARMVAWINFEVVLAAGPEPGRGRARGCVGRERHRACLDSRTTPRARTCTYGPNPCIPGRRQRCWILTGTA